MFGKPGVRKEDVVPPYMRLENWPVGLHHMASHVITYTGMDRERAALNKRGGPFPIVPRLGGPNVTTAVGKVVPNGKPGHFEVLHVELDFDA